VVVTGLGDMDVASVPMRFVLPEGAVVHDAESRAVAERMAEELGGVVFVVFASWCSRSWHGS